MIKSKKIIIGTHNKGKFKELSYLLSKKLQKISPGKYNIKAPKETGSTFNANALLKANYFFKKTKTVSLSDDSGLSVSCLGQKPGIHSARFAKKCGSFTKAMKKIIKLVNAKNKNKNKKTENRRAIFTCSLSLKINAKKSITVQGKIFGKISNKILGKKGFGYDSIFLPHGYTKTFGQMNKKKKMIIDHRYIAFKKLKKKANFL